MSNLVKKYQPSCQMVYPPFKSGLYLEEFFHRFWQQQDAATLQDFGYIDIYWTNLFCNHAFYKQPINFDELQQYIRAQYQDQSKLYFTVAQSDDGCSLVEKNSRFDPQLPSNTLRFGSCNGDIPLPLIYEDDQFRLESMPRIAYAEKKYTCSFVGAMTHPLRRQLLSHLQDQAGFYFQPTRWRASVPTDDAENFMQITQQSKFSLAPRGNGRSSFRFFEALRLGVIPIYVWDDYKWLPYEDELDYSEFSVCIRNNEIAELPSILARISESEYQGMLARYEEIKDYFYLQGMSEYILRRLRRELT